MRPKNKKSGIYWIKLCFGNEKFNKVVVGSYDRKEDVWETIGDEGIISPDEVWAIGDEIKKPTTMAYHT